MRWSDDGYRRRRRSFIEISPVRQYHDGLEGCIFHEACWDLLEEAFSPAPVPLPRLLAICNSLPTPTHSGALDWGHDYGGATVVDRVNYFPWEDAVTEPTLPSPNPVFYSDPYHIPEIAHILAEDPGEPPAALHCNDSSTATPPQGIDCFAGIPMELRLAITMHLPTADAMRLRLASRAFQPLFHSQQFWASRFATASSDRGWLFETRQRESNIHSNREPTHNPPAPGTDWRWLYRRTNNTHLQHLPLGLRNRHRIWRLMQSLINLLHHRWVRPPFPSPNANADAEQQQPPSVWHAPTDPDAPWQWPRHSHMHPQHPQHPQHPLYPQPTSEPEDPLHLPTAGRWRAVSAHMWPVCEKADGWWSPFYRGCRVFERVDVLVPEDLVRVGVVTVGVDVDVAGEGEGAEYVAGLVLETAGGEMVRLGYHPGEGAVVAGRSVGFEAGGLSGFGVAMGARGVQGLQCVVAGPAGDRVLLPWLGSPEDVPRTERLAAVAGRVVGLILLFDVSSGVPYLPSERVSLRTHTIMLGTLYINLHTGLQDGQPRDQYRPRPLTHSSPFTHSSP